MKRITFWTAALLLASALMYGQSRQMPEYLEYIETYKKAAIEQQKGHNIPASISMAQGLLESGAGKSELARKANNHFGIKCTSDWTGDTYHKNDDKKNDCFRKYKRVEDSWEDHSKFLLRPRYQELFSLKITDYKGWAHGLKRCGYATDPTYPAKLIKIIEDYGLDKLVSEAGAQHKKEKNKDKTADKDKAHDTKADNDRDQGVMPGDTMELKDKKDFKELAGMKDVTLYQDHKSGYENGTRYIIAEEGESFSSLSYFLNMSEKQLRKYNDATDGRRLRKGDRVYLFKKHKYADRKHKSYYVRKNDTAWSIAQKFGFQMKSIYTLNGIPEGTPLTTRQELRLRK
ncbi:MAG: glucosaminidase domain-containing protein [Paludibacteraceae bacterium]|nr:glucosaminidase domain-containing protein [Paludibacteraceae bacterium]